MERDITALHSSSSPSGFLPHGVPSHAGRTRSRTARRRGVSGAGGARAGRRNRHDCCPLRGPFAQSRRRSGRTWIRWCRHTFGGAAGDGASAHASLRDPTAGGRARRGVPRRRFGARDRTSQPSGSHRAGRHLSRRLDRRGDLRAPRRDVSAATGRRLHAVRRRRLSAAECCRFGGGGSTRASATVIRR